MRIFNALVTGFNKIEFRIDDVNEFMLSKVHIFNEDNELTITSYSSLKDNISISLSKPLNIKRNCFIKYSEGELIKCNYFRLFTAKEFNDKYYYSGELGLNYSKAKSSFKVWSPAAIEVDLLLYKNGDVSIPESPRSIPMKEDAGLWSITVEEDLNGSYYTYKVKLDGEVNEAVDPYAKAVGVNGLRGAIIDMSSTNPEGFKKDFSPKTIKNFTDAVIYELSIRDISSNPNSGIKNSGKYLGLTERNTMTKNGKPTGLDYIKELGITHVQIMPTFDFSYKSIDEKNPTKYNWGYDPQNYNVPEGSYSTNPYDPCCRIKELKFLIKTLHENGICVNLDVVYNHLWHEKENNFEKIFPGYYLRMNDDGGYSNGSVCSNDTASENLMMQKFIIDSVLYFVKEYHIDGFRFDLMGLHDIDTMNKLRELLSKFDKKVMLYGEGWDLDTTFPKEKKATIYNAHKLPNVGFFNDIIRDSIKGSVFITTDKGFVSGKTNLENIIKLCSAGSIDYSPSLSGPFLSPEQSINYVSCHDNATIWDRLISSNPNDSEELRISRLKLALGIILTSQGIPFLHCGCEFGRTKKGIENSFISPDEINWIDWDLRDKFIDCADYIKALVKFRRRHPAFRFNNSSEIKNHLNFIDNTPKNTVAFILKNKPNDDIWNNIIVIYNGNENSVNIPLLAGTWNLCVDKNNVGETCLKTSQDIHTAEGLSLNILYN